MKKFIIFILIVGALAVFILGNNTIIRTPNGFYMLKKSTFVLENSYVDISNWGVVNCYRNTKIRNGILNGQIGDFNNMRAKLIAADTAVNVSHRIIEVTQKVEQGINNFDRKHEISKKARQFSDDVSRKSRDLDKKYHITEKTNQAVEKTMRAGRKFYKNFF